MARRRFATMARAMLPRNTRCTVIAACSCMRARLRRSRWALEARHQVLRRRAASCICSQRHRMRWPRYSAWMRATPATHSCHGTGFAWLHQPKGEG